MTVDARIEALADPLVRDLARGGQVRSLARNSVFIHEGEKAIRCSSSSPAASRSSSPTPMAARWCSTSTAPATTSASWRSTATRGRPR